MTKFYTAKIRNGKLVTTHVRTLSQSAMLACPHFIMDPSHYRTNSTCRCDDHMHVEMLEWGYEWDNESGLWIAPKDPED